MAEERKPMFDAGVNLPGAEIEKKEMAGFRAFMRDETGRRMTKKGYREMLEQDIRRAIHNERDLQVVNRKQMLQDQSWYHGNFARQDRLASAVPELSDLTVNIVKPAVDYVAGTARDMRLQGSVRPTGATGYTNSDLNRVAQEFDARLKIAQDVGGFRKTLNKAIQDACTCGVGYWETTVQRLAGGDNYRILYRSHDFRNVYKDSSVLGMEEARYCHVLRRVDKGKLALMFPDKRALIQEMVTEYDPMVSVDETYDAREAVQGVGGGFRRGGGLPVDGSEYSREVVIFGTGWVKDSMPDERGEIVDVTVKVYFVSDEGLENVRLLKDPQFVFGHNQIPMTELVFATRDSDRMPYTPLIRHRRGLQELARIVLRSMVEHMNSRSVVMRLDQNFPKGLQVPDYVRDVQTRAMEPNMVLFVWGDNMVNFEHNEQRIEQHASVLQTVLRLSGDMSGIHPALLGSETNLESSVAMSKAARDAMRAQSAFLENVAEAVRHSSEQTLSIIEQFAGLIDYPARMERGRLIEMGSDKEMGIPENRMMYHVKPIMREEALSDSLNNVIAEAIKGAPSFSIPLMTLSLKNNLHTDAIDIVQDMVDLSRQMGQPVAPSLLSEEEQQQQEQAQAAQAQAQQQAQAAETAKVESEAMKNQASAMKDQAEAQAPSEGMKELQMRETIRRQAERIMELEGQGRQ